MFAIATAGLLPGLWIHGCGGKGGGDQEVIGAGGLVTTTEAGGAAGTGGGRGCPTCGPLEQCFENLFCVAKLVPVTGGYSIDATEVTRDQYAAWLATNPPTSGQGAMCSWNADFTPNTAVPNDGCDVSFWPPAINGNHPVGCVDWCDAYAYCKAAGKRLCGKIGGGPNLYTDIGDASKSQWFNACSAGGIYNYPYGGNPSVGKYDGYAEQRCNGREKEVGTTVPVGSCPECNSTEPGYTGVFDLSGNVWEWEDACQFSDGGSDYCRIRGGSYVAPFTNLRCYDPLNAFRRDQGSKLEIGFRCCSDP